jgi:hypothetical protein
LDESADFAEDLRVIQSLNADALNFASLYRLREASQHGLGVEDGPGYAAEEFSFALAAFSLGAETAVGGAFALFVGH